MCQKKICSKSELRLVYPEAHSFEIKTAIVDPNLREKPDFFYSQYPSLLELKNQPPPILAWFRFPNSSAYHVGPKAQ